MTHFIYLAFEMNTHVTYLFDSLPQEFESNCSLLYNERTEFYHRSSVFTVLLVSLILGILCFFLSQLKL